MKRLVLIVATALLMLGFAPTTAFAETDPAAAPNGTHLQSGTIGCSTNTATDVVTCSTYELAGVGNANATAALTVNYTATVDCRNRGGQIVEVKAQVTGATFSTGSLSPKNGRLRVPALSSSGTPTAAQFEAGATCPNGNWTKVTQTETIAVSGFTYTLTFAGFNSPYITITG